MAAVAAAMDAVRRSIDRHAQGMDRDRHRGGARPVSARRRRDAGRSPVSLGERPRQSLRNPGSGRQDRRNPLVVGDTCFPTLGCGRRPRPPCARATDRGSADEFGHAGLQERDIVAPTDSRGRKRDARSGFERQLSGQTVRDRELSSGRARKWRAAQPSRRAAGKRRFLGRGRGAAEPFLRAETIVDRNRRRGMIVNARRKSRE